MSISNKDRLERDFVENSNGSRFTGGQIQVILLYPIGYRAIVAFGGMLIGYQISQGSLLIGYLTIGFAMLLFVTKVCPGVVDLLRGRPELVKGTINKEKIQNRGPMHYMIDIGSVRLESRKEDWLEILDGAKYETYYAPYSKWLLSCREVTDSSW